MQNYSPQSPAAPSAQPEPIPDLSDLEISPNAQKTLWLAAIVAAICGGLYGYDTGIVSGALLLITRDFHLSSFYQEMVASAILAGAVMGSFITGWMSERFGRRNSVMIVTAVFVTGALACAWAPDVYALIAARVFLGLAVGGSTQVVPMYISELAPAKKRGHMVTMFNIAIGVGIFAANVIGFAARDAWGWRPMVAIAAIPAAVVFVSMFFLPKSPRWAAENESLDSAIEQLRRIRTTRREIRKEIKRIQVTANDDAAAHESGWRG